MTANKNSNRWWLNCRRLLSCLLGFCMVGNPVVNAEEAPAKADTKDKAPAPEESSSRDFLPKQQNWVDLSLGGVFVDGDDAQFQQRHYMKKGAFGGIEDFHYEGKSGKKSYFEIDGRALFDNEDYNLRFELARPEVGYLRGGFKQLRTWYDDNGGFYPPSGAWFTLDDSDMHLDRGDIWFEGGLTLPNIPSITFKYSHEYRNGKKDSTIWGDSNLTSPGPSFSTPVNLRGMVPSFRDINEKRHVFEVDAKHTIKKTDLGVGLRYDVSDNDNSLNVLRRPGEGSSERYMTQHDGVESDMLHMHAYTETRLSEKVRFTTAYGYTSLDSDLSGSRIYGSYYGSDFMPVYANSPGYYNLAGGSQLDEHVVTLNLMAQPWKHFAVVPSLRFERLDVDSRSTFMASSSGQTAPLDAASERGLTEVVERLEMRYTGFTNWVLYARGDWSQGQGNMQESGGFGPTLSTPPVDRLTDDTRLNQRYTVGANWYPRRNLNIDAQYYHRIRNVDYDHLRDSTPNYDGSYDMYPAFITANDLTTDDVNIRVTFRPRTGISLVTRYDCLLSNYKMTPDSISGLSAEESAQSLAHMFGQNITWIPWSRLYLQAGFNYVLDQTDTPADQYSQAVTDSNNDYWNLNFTTGFVIDNKTDLQLQYFYYNADNYQNISASGMPYGVSAEEHAFTASITRQFTEKIRVSLKYGFYHNQDETSGYHNDYDAHLIYTTWRYQF